MRSIITIAAASAALSASLCAGLAATDAATGQRRQPAIPTLAKAEAPAARTTWIDPPAKADPACRDAAWPYRGTLCAATGGAGETPARKVRMIPTRTSTTVARR